MDDPNSKPQPSVVFLDEGDVDVFVADSAAGDVVAMDDAHAEGLLLSLMSGQDRVDASRSSLSSARSVLAMFDSVSRHTSAPACRGATKFVRSLPVVDGVRCVVWPEAQNDPAGEMVRVSNAQYFQNIAAIRSGKDASHAKVTVSVEQAAKAFQLKEDSKKAIQTSFHKSDAILLGGYRHPVHLSEEGESVGAVVGVAMLEVSSSASVRNGKRSASSHPHRVFDVDAYLESLRALKEGDEVAVFEPEPEESYAPKQQPRKAMRITRVDASSLTLDGHLVVPTTSVDPCGVLVNAAYPKLPFKAIRRSKGTHWKTLASWLSMDPLSALKRAGGSFPTVQESLDNIGWPVDCVLSRRDWERIAKASRITAASTLSQPPPTPQNRSDPTASPEVEEWVRRGAYIRHVVCNVEDRNAPFAKAWAEVKQMDGGLLVLLSAVTKVPVDVVDAPGEFGDLGDFDVTNVTGAKGCVFKQSPFTVMGRFVSGAAEDEAIRECDQISFLDFAGLKGLVAMLEADHSTTETIGSHVLEWAGLQPPSAEFVTGMRQRALESMAQRRAEELAGVPRRDMEGIARHMREVATFLLALRLSKNKRSSGATFHATPTRASTSTLADSEVEMDGADWQLSAEDGAHYSNYSNSYLPEGATTRNGTPAGVDDKRWDYKNLLQLFCLASGASLGNATFAFLVNNAIFVNPVELYMKRLRRAIHELKSRRQVNMAQWKGGPRAYDQQEERMIAKMRRDTMGIFCTRTLACYAALIVLAEEQGVLRVTPALAAYKCVDRGGAAISSPLSCVAEDIVRDGLMLPFEIQIFEKNVSAFLKDFKTANKVVPGKGDSLSHAPSLGVAEVWTGFRPGASRSTPVMGAIERIVEASVVDSPAAAAVHQRRAAVSRTTRCCQGDAATAPFYFVSNPALDAVVQHERATATAESIAWANEYQPRSLWTMSPAGVSLPPARSDFATDAATEVAHVQMPSRDAMPATPSAAIAAWRSQNPSYEHLFSTYDADPHAWAKDALNACRSRMDRASESAGRPGNLGSLLVPAKHVSRADLKIRHRIATRFVRGGMATILARAKSPHFMGVKGMEDLSAHVNKQTFALVVSVISGCLAATTTAAVLRALVDDLRSRLEFNMIDEQELQLSLQKQREDDKAQKLQAAHNLTDEQREILQEYRKFKRVSWNEIADHIGIRPDEQPAAGEKDRLENDVVSEKDVTVIRPNGLGAVDRDGDTSNDNVDYD